MLSNIKKIIDEKLSTIDQEIADLEESSRPVVPDVSLGRLTRMDAIGQKSINEAALNNTKLKKEKLLATLKRIDSDEFGFCIDCGDEINTKRLLAAPWSTVCMDCAE